MVRGFLSVRVHIDSEDYVDKSWCQALSDVRDDVRTSVINLQSKPSLSAYRNSLFLHVLL